MIVVFVWTVGLACVCFAAVGEGGAPLEAGVCSGMNDGGWVVVVAVGVELGSDAGVGIGVDAGDDVWVGIGVAVEVAAGVDVKRDVGVDVGVLGGTAVGDGEMAVGVEVRLAAVVAASVAVALGTGHRIPTPTGMTAVVRSVPLLEML